jgi:hypothetical protein
MPIDDFFNYKKERVDWKYKLCLWPRKSSISRKILWGKRAYRGVLMITGPGDPVFITHWVSKEEFLLGRLRGTL